MNETHEDTGTPRKRRPPPRAVLQHGPAVRALREKDGYTQAALAEMVGIRQQSVAQIESEFTSARMSTLNRLARALGVPVAAILARDAIRVPARKAPSRQARGAGA